MANLDHPTPSDQPPVPLTCPSEAEILRFSLPDSVPDDVTASHLSGCASCRARVADIRRVVQGIRASAGTVVAGGGECLDELALAKLVDGVASPGEREAHITHLAGCGRCRRQLAALVELLADPEVAAEVRSLERPRDRSAPRRKFLAGAGLIAAAAVVLVLVRPGSGRQDTDRHRGPTITASAAPLPLSPIGDVPGATTLRWTAVPGAERYRLTLFDAAGKLLFETQTSDTVTALPDSVVIAPGR